MEEKLYISVFWAGKKGKNRGRAFVTDVNKYLS